MPITTVSSRTFNQDASGAKKAALHGPVIITDRGRPAHVLLTFEDYRKLTGATKKIADLLAMDDDPALEFDPPRASAHVRPVDLS